MKSLCALRVGLFATSFFATMSPSRAQESKPGALSASTPDCPAASSSGDELISINNGNDDSEAEKDNFQAGLPKGLRVEDLPSRQLRDCAGLPGQTSLTEIEALRERLLHPRPGVPEDNPYRTLSLRITYKFPGAVKPFLWIIPGRAVCLMDNSEAGMTMLSRAPLSGSRSEDDAGFEWGWGRQFEWDEDPASGEHLLLFYQNGGSLGGWAAQLISISAEGRVMKLSGEMSDEDVFSDLSLTRDPQGRIILWSDINSKAEQRGGWLCAQGRHEDEMERKYVAAELKLGRRLTPRETEQYEEGDCAPNDERANTPSECYRLSSAGIEPAECPDSSIADVQAAADENSQPEQDPKQDQPRRLPVQVINWIDRKRDSGERWDLPDPNTITESILKDCMTGPISGKPQKRISAGQERSDLRWLELLRNEDAQAAAPPSYISVPYAIPEIERPALIAVGDAFCLVGELNDKTTLLSAIRIPVAATPYAWLLWLPGSSARYRYLVHATLPDRPRWVPFNWLKDSPTGYRPITPQPIPAGDSVLRLFRLDVGMKKLTFLHQLNVTGDWNAYEVDDQPVIANYDPYELARLSEICPTYKFSNSPEMKIRCDPMLRADNRLAIVTHNRLKIVNPEMPQ